MKLNAAEDVTTSPTPIDSVLKVRIPVKDRSNQLWLYAFSAVLIAIITIEAYRPTLFNFFISDDFGIIVWMNAWLKQAKNILPVLQQFYQPWMMNPSHYRPLMGAIWIGEYSIWGANGFFFRLSSIVCMFLSSFILALIVFEVSRKSNPFSSQSHRTRVVWIVLSAALFALYPLHCEPINWCVCQHDMSVTFFCLLSFWCYIWWRHYFSPLALIISLCSMVLGLLCKEMAVTLPLVIFGYELLHSNNVNRDLKQFDAFKFSAKIKDALSITAPYWLILSIYLCLRKIILGTFTGSLPIVYYAGQSDMFRTWLLSIWRMLVPVNISIVDRNHPIIVAWEIIVFFALSLSFYAFRITNRRKLGTFLLVWLVLSLAPAYLLFIISPNLAGEDLLI